MRLQKYLSRAGVASRREGERLIEAGRVTVDGAVVTVMGTKVVPGEQQVRVDGRSIDLRPERWIAIYKPAGYLTARGDDRGRRTIYSLLPQEFGDLFHVGRLDRLSEGLLLLTNAGDVAHRMLHPSFEIPRRYAVEVEGPVGGVQIGRLEAGVELEDGLARGEDVRAESVPGRRTRIWLTMREGRKREVRRIMDALGLKVVRLVRWSFGPIELGDLRPGEHRELHEDEITALEESVGLREPDGDT